MPEVRQPEELEGLLEYIHRMRGFDFSSYKRTTLERRIGERMAQVGIATYADYQEYLGAIAGEFNQLFRAILISLTGFFRDREAWRFLQAHVVPEIVKRKGPREPIRAWCVGCATGEEAYTLAMVLAEHVDEERAPEGAQLKIFATDLDEMALAAARAAAYSPAAIEPIPGEMRDRFLLAAGNGYVVRPELRQSLIFGRHDLLRDPPISNLDLIVCRNMLMYFNSEAQSKAARRLHFALRPGAHIFVGKAEMLLANVPHFEVVNLQQRIFRKAHGTASGADFWMGAIEDAANVGFQAPATAAPESGSVPRPAAQVFVDVHQRLLSFNEEARRLFALGDEDLHKPFYDLRVGEGAVQLAGSIQLAHREGAAQWIERVVRPSSIPKGQVFDVLIVPLEHASGAAWGTTITFLARTAEHGIELQLARVADELTIAREKLLAQSQMFRAASEELRQTNHRLVALNTELQSMNRDLGSANADLMAVNETLRSQSGEGSNAPRMLHSLLQNLPLAVAGVDNEFRVLIWSRRAEELLGVRQEDAVGQQLFGLQTPLPTARLVLAIRAAFRDNERVREVMPRHDDERSTVQVTLVPVRLGGWAEKGVILLFEPVHGSDADTDT